MDKTLNQIIISLLKTKSNEYLTARDIAEFIWENETDFCNKKMKNTTKKGKDELISQIIAEVGSRYPRGLNNVISRTADRPHKYYYDNKSSFFPILKKEMKNKCTVYQWRRIYLRENKNNLCPTLTANMGEGRT